MEKIKCRYEAYFRERVNLHFSSSLGSYMEGLWWDASIPLNGYLGPNWVIGLYTLWANLIYIYHGQPNINLCQTNIYPSIFIGHILKIDDEIKKFTNSTSMQPHHNLLSGKH